jgi:hypothetical protein
MRRIIILLSLTAILGHVALAQVTPLYFTIVTHNEENQPFNLTNFYTLNRAELVELAQHVNAEGMKWNMQSDQRFLNSVIQQDTPFFAITGGKNLLRWMHEDMGIEMDPHAHETIYTYPDVVHLMDSLGLPESKVIGGTIYNDNNGINIWTDLVGGQYGNVFPDAYWEPLYMMGGGTPNHVDDLRYHGFWNPTSTTDYLTHDPNSPLTHLGVGCDIKVQDTSTVAYTVNRLREVIDDVQSGTYDPANPFYLQILFFEHATLNTPSFNTTVYAILDSMDAMVEAGDAQWRTFSEAYTEWENLGSPVYQWECGQELMTSIQEAAVGSDAMSLYPVPTAGLLTVQWSTAATRMLTIIDVTGREVMTAKTTGSVANIDLSELPAGPYLLRTTNADGIFNTRKLLKQ